jgi:hypothetical protein
MIHPLTALILPAWLVFEFNNPELVFVSPKESYESVLEYNVSNLTNWNKIVKITKTEPIEVSFSISFPSNINSVNIFKFTNK